MKGEKRNALPCPLIDPLFLQTYDASVTLTSSQASMTKGDSAMFIVEAFVTEPAADWEFGVFQPLGYNVGVVFESDLDSVDASFIFQDVFHIGKISKDVGNAFSCSPEKFWIEEYRSSPSGMSVNNASVKYPMLINREGTVHSTSTLSKTRVVLKLVAQLNETWLMWPI